MNLEKLYADIRAAKVEEVRLQAGLEDKRSQLAQLQTECMEEFGVPLSELRDTLEQKKKEAATAMVELRDKLSVLNGLGGESE